MSGIRQFEKYCEKRAKSSTIAKCALTMLGRFFATVPPNRKARPATSRKVTDELRERIAKLDARGLTQHDIARELGVNQGRVNETLKGE